MIFGSKVTINSCRIKLIFITDIIACSEYTSIHRIMLYSRQQASNNHLHNSKIEQLSILQFLIKKATHQVGI